MRYQSSRTGQRRSPLAPFLLILAGALLIGFLAGVFLSGDGDDPAAQTSPSLTTSGSGAPVTPPATPPASTDGSATPPSAPPPVVAAPEGLLPPGSVARVTVPVLRIREAPDSGSRMLDQLPVNQLVEIGPANVGWGPVSGEGFAWYPVRRLGELTELPALPTELPDGAVGWAAAGDPETAYLELVAPRCPARPATLAILESMLRWERLSCFGPEAITIDGTFGCAGCGGATVGSFEPEWLASPSTFAPLSVDPNARIGPFDLRFKPDGPAAPAPGSTVRLTGHFDDPAAAGCTVAPGDPPMAIDSATAALWCREQFVVDALEVTGTDPDFPTG
ncbi:MAG TPA: SH3 domain-containing protein [Candidatus Limnocylindria bacterium]|nr:SH3 domain-containing protein [Candidatus Limnocylindria bacterium]